MQRLEKIDRGGDLALRLTNADAFNAKCGHPTQCVIARAIKRTYEDATSVIVNYNIARFTLNGLYHHFTMTNTALKIAWDTDRGVLLARERSLVLPRIGNPRPVVKVSKDEAYRRRVARRKRTAEGYYKNYKSPDNVRLEAAKRAGVAHKRLASLNLQPVADSYYVTYMTPYMLAQLKINAPGPSGTLGGAQRFENKIVDSVESDGRLVLSAKDCERSKNYASGKYGKGGPNDRLRRAFLGVVWTPVPTKSES